MIKIEDKSKCSGCHTCYSICPKNAITMEQDDNGFKYPKVDEDKCIDCGLCEKMCPIINNKKISNKPIAYAVMNKNSDDRFNSSAGGVFCLLANYILDNDGVIFGAAFDDEFMVHHICITNKKELSKLMKSKYVQSTIGNTYKECKEYLDQDKKVLFTGTPCQIEGLLLYLKKDYNNLYTQDIICHGVPSPKYYKMYLNSLSKNKLKNVDFRYKEDGWNNYKTLIEFDNKSFKFNHSTNTYMKAFIGNYILRESCYDCKFKKENRLSDITLGDFWGIDNVDKSMNDNKGTGLVIVNSDKGKELFNAIKDNTIYKDEDFYKSIKGNPSFNTSSSKPNNRDKFLNEINENNFDQIVNKYTKQPFIKRIKNKCRSIIKKIIKK